MRKMATAAYLFADEETIRELHVMQDLTPDWGAATGDVKQMGKAVSDAKRLYHATARAIARHGRTHLGYEQLPLIGPGQDQ